MHTKRQKSLPGNIFLVSLYIIAVVCGAALMGLEILGGRLLSPFFGGSVYVWGSIISVFLTALSVGYYLGGILADRKPDLVYLAGCIAVAGLLILPIPTLAPWLSNYSFSVGLSNYGALVVALFLFFLPSLGLGMVSPYVVKLGVSGTDRLGNLVGKFYAASTFGSIFGTLATTFLLIPFFGVKEIILTLGIILVVMATLVLFFQRSWLYGLVACLLMACLLWLSLTFAISPANSQHFTVVYSKESLYNDIFVRDYGDHRYMMFTDKLLQSGMSKLDPTFHLFNYTRLMDEAALYFKPQASEFLLIGLGGGSIPKALLASRQSALVDVVDIDPEVINVARDYFDLPDSSELQAVAMDGRMFLRSTKKKYDVIMIDAYNSLSIPHHLVTKEYFGEVASVLKPDGIIIANIISNAEGEYSTFFKSLLHTINQVFPEWRLFLAEDENSTDINNLILVASRTKLESPGHIAGFFEYQRPIDVTGMPVLTDNFAPVEMLSNKLINKISGGG